MNNVFCEPASVAGVELLRNSGAVGRVDAANRRVCVLNGNGLENAARALNEAASAVVEPVRALADSTACRGLLGFPRQPPSAIVLDAHSNCGAN
jgi:threonine synthase